MKRYLYGIVLLFFSSYAHQDIPLGVLKAPTFQEIEQEVPDTPGKQEATNFAANLMLVRKAKQDGQPWVKPFDELCQMLEMAQIRCTPEARAMMLKAAQEHNFEKLWQERYNLWNVVVDNGDEVGWAIAKIAIAGSAINNLNKLYKKLEHNPQQNVSVAQAGGQRYALAIVTTRTQHAQEMHENQQEGVAVREGRITFTRYALKRPGVRDVALGTIGVVGAQFNQDAFKEKPTQQFLCGAALVLTNLMGLNNPEIVTPLVAAVTNSATCVMVGMQVAPVAQTLWNDWSKQNKCPLEDMQRQLAVDKEKLRQLRQKQQERLRRLQEGTPQQGQFKPTLISPFGNLNTPPPGVFNTPGFGPQQPNSSD